MRGVSVRVLTQTACTERKHVRSGIVLLPLHLVTLLTVCHYRNGTDRCSCLHVKLLSETRHGAKINSHVSEYSNGVFSATHWIKKKKGLCNTSGCEVCFLFFLSPLWRHFLSPLHPTSENVKVDSLKRQNEEFVLRNSVPSGHEPHDCVFYFFLSVFCWGSHPVVASFPLIFLRIDD